MLSYSPSVSRPALREGVIFGIGIGVLLVVLALISMLAGGGVLSSIISLLDVAIIVFGYMLAGTRASQQTGKIATGALAGLIAGVIAYVINLLFLYLLTLMNMDRVREMARRSISEPAVREGITDQAIISATLGTAVLLLVIYGVIAGVLIGILGGRLGKKRSMLRSGATTSGEVER